MKNIKLYKDSILTNEASFSTEEELQDWLSRHEDMGAFLLSDKTVVTKSVDGQETVEVVPATHTFVITDLVDDSARIKANAEAQAYLDSTDWQIIRELETGIPCDLGVKEKRQAARDSIVK